MNQTALWGGPGVALLMALGQPAGAQVVPDGTSATTVSVGTDGTVTVGIAPTVSNGVSHNRYTELNVPKAGVALDNRTEAARTIVNEVTGTGTTTIAGPVEVLGQRAHVIMANPNGIVVDAGRFINTGRVALTTGAIGTQSRQIAPGIFQQNVTATVSAGRITIAGGGLSGTMDAVDLIANDLKVAGAVVNASTTTEAGMTLTAGHGTTEFDSAVLPGNTSLGWARTTGAGVRSDGAILVDITVDGALRANQIGIVVSDLGAGVRLAGTAFATARSFTLTADGAIGIAQGQIKGRTGVALRGESVAALDAVISASEGAAEIRATTGAVALTGSSITAAYLGFSAPQGLAFADSTLRSDSTLVLDTDNDITLDNSQLRGAGDALITARSLRLRGDASPSALVAESGALIASLTGELEVTGALIQGSTRSDGVRNDAGLASAGAVTINAAGDILIRNGQSTGIMFGAAADMHLRVGGDLRLDQGRIVTNGDLNLDVAGDLVNGFGTPGAEGLARTTSSKRTWWSLGFIRKKITTWSVAPGTGGAGETPVIQASGALSITADRILNHGGEINANGGDMTLRARTIDSSARVQGDLVMRKTCTFFCSVTADGTARATGGGINALGNMTLTAREAFLVRGGNILTFGDLEVLTPAASVGTIDLPTVVARPRGLYSFFDGSSAWVSMPTTGGNVSAEGKIAITSGAPVRLAGGSLIAGGEVLTPNGTESVVQAPTRNSPGGRDIGFFHALPLIGN